MSNHSTTHESQISRLQKIEGQVRGIKGMIENKRYCVDILTQLRSEKYVRLLEILGGGVLLSIGLIYLYRFYQYLAAS